MRLKQSPAIRKLDSLREKHKLGRIIELLSARSPDQLELQSLPCPTTGQITDHFNIQAILNEYFEDWLAIPRGLDAAADLLANHHSWWKSLLTFEDKPGLQLLQAKSSIPPALQDGLRRVCAIKVGPEVQQAIRQTLTDMITFEDFDDSIGQLTYGGAGGPSENTASMVKAWSPGTRRLVYQHMQNIWTTRTTPKWFKDKVLKLAPKLIGNSELKNMRPISLYEILRKLWTTIVGKRIHLTWHNFRVLNGAQYGYRLDNGTHMALFNVINQIEGASHDKATKHVTFWDIRRAFDSIPRNLQKLSWVRLGVPMEIAEWFVDLDDGGLTFISSPYYHLNKDLKAPEEMLKANTHFTGAPEMGFLSGRGIGQGESASSLMWTALYDILLDFIDPANRHFHEAEGDLQYTNTDIDNTSLNAYADDLSTLTSGPKAEYMQQLQATWLSAFCAFAGLVIHPAKIHTTILGPIPAKYDMERIIGPPAYTEKTDLLVHDLNWNPVSCPITPRLLTVKYLGVHLDLRHEAQASLERVLQDIHDRISHLLLQPGSPTVKLDYIHFKIIPIALATAVCANWSLKQYRHLDRPFTAAYRQLLAFPAKAPEYLLYLPQKEMGVGLPRFSDKAQVMKWQSLMRCIAVGAEPEASVNSFFDRLPVTSSTVTKDIRTFSPPATWPRNRRFIVRSLIEWLHQSDLAPCCRLPDQVPHDDQSRTNTSIRDIAEHLLLWPNSDYTDEDNANLPVIRLIATDGSFKIQPRGAFDIITPERDLRDIGKGTGGIVFLPPGYNEQSMTPQAVRIHHQKHEPGMNAYTWELVTQLIALHFTKYLPSHAVHTSDCTGAIARTNHSLRTAFDQQPNERGGIFATGAHAFSNPFCPRQFIHTKAHPERDPKRTANPTVRDKAICMADAVAGRTKAKLGQRHFPMHRHELKLDDLFHEIIPPGTWHLRTTGHSPFPVVGDILPFQHKAQLKILTHRRDLHHDHDYWKSTSFAFANTVHPLHSRAYWPAARRTLLAFDWIGHGRNRAKLSSLTPEQRAHTEKCVLCGMKDSQQHCMLECPHPPFTAIREIARKAQAEAATLMRAKYPSRGAMHFTDQICHGSWTPSANTSRLWLGLWNRPLLEEVLRQDLEAPLTMTSRKKYLKIAKALTKPLINAYTGLLLIINATQAQQHIANDRTTPTRHHLPTSPLLHTTRAALETAHPQEQPQDVQSLMLNLDSVHNITPYTLSDAAYLIEYADRPP